jgi:hypothetical protein
MKMKRLFIYFAVGIVLLIVGFMAGRISQYFRNGYDCRVIDQKEYASPLGTIQLSHVFETIGFQVFATETTIISLGDRTIYKAERVFQENDPYVADLKTSENSITWDDGRFRFHLTVEAAKKGKSDGTANGSPQTRAEPRLTPEPANLRR